ncbi:MAG: DUF1573 domain-containing protein [Thermoguttaceae bacterium]
MRVWIAVILTLVVGVGLGFGSALVRIERFPWAGGALRPAPSKTAAPTAGMPQPEAQVDRDTHEFGTMDMSAQGSHEFVVRNIGKAPLDLSPGPSSCKCTLSDLSEHTIVPPGGQKTVKVSWKSKGISGAFRQSASILTNDPNRSKVTFTITGRFSVGAKAVPSELVFSRVMSGEPATGSVQLFGFRPEPLKPQDIKWDDPSTAKYFEAKFLPLSAEQVNQEEGATSGSLLEITVKSGLPIGPFQQKISVTTNLKETPTIEVPIRGKVASEITIVGPGWDETGGMLMMGTVNGRQGAQRTLWIIAGGSHAKDIQFKSVEVGPDLLKAELGTPKPIQGGSATQVPLTITIPPGSPPANHLGSEQGKVGRIMIETNHPHSPKLLILVRFAIEG